jgi:hypothetical protein
MCVRGQVRALWDYAASTAEELSLEEDDVVTLTGIVDGGWWEGELNGAVGFFPANFVEVVRSDEGVRHPLPHSHTHRERERERELCQ